MDIEQKILNLKDGEVWTWPESDYGKAEIWRKHDVYFLFEIPSFGGQPVYTEAYIKTDIPLLIATVEKWS
jgi:hypothetical protein